MEPIEKHSDLKILKKLLIDIHNLPLHKQEKTLEKKFEKWKGEIDQVDDILIVGIKM